MFYPCELMFKNYKPLLLEQGMLFLTKFYEGKENEYAELWELKNVPIDTNVFISDNGYPVELSIIDDEGKFLAEHETIGWWQEENKDELRNITLRDINNVLQNYDGILEIDVDDFYLSMDVISPKIFDGRVILKELTEEFDEGI